MATYNDMGISDLSFTASGDLNSHQYRFVQPSATSGYVSLATGASNPMPFGVLQNDPRDGEEAEVKILGVSQVWFCGSVALEYGEFVCCGSEGAAEKAALSSVGAVALQGLSAGSGYAKMLLFPFHSVLADNTP